MVCWISVKLLSSYDIKLIVTNDSDNSLLSIMSNSKASVLKWWQANHSVTVSTPALAILITFHSCTHMESS